MTIAGFDEVSDLFGRLRINNPAKPRRLAARHADHATVICDHADLNTADPCMSRDHLLCVVSLKLVEMTVVEQALEQLPHVVRLSMIFGNDLVKFIRRS